MGVGDVIPVAVNAPACGSGWAGAGGRPGCRRVLGLSRSRRVGVGGRPGCRRAPRPSRSRRGVVGGVGFGQEAAPEDWRRLVHASTGRNNATRPCRQSARTRGTAFQKAGGGVGGGGGGGEGPPQQGIRKRQNQPRKQPALDQTTHRNAQHTTHSTQRTAHNAKRKNVIGTTQNQTNDASKNRRQQLKPDLGTAPRSTQPTGLTRTRATNQLPTSPKPTPAPLPEAHSGVARIRTGTLLRR